MGVLPLRHRSHNKAGFQSPINLPLPLATFQALHRYVQLLHSL